MKKKIITGYCPDCEKRTKHQIIHCTESLGMRIFANIFTFGIIAAEGYEYACECLECGKINMLYK